MRAQAKEADERLLIEAAQKDPARFVDLYEENFERVYAFVSRRVHSRADVEDITAEVFHQALANIATFEWRGVPFAAWLYRVAANAIADRWQSLARESGQPVMKAPSVEFDGAEIERAERRAQVFRQHCQIAVGAAARDRNAIRRREKYSRNREGAGEIDRRGQAASVPSLREIARAGRGGFAGQGRCTKWLDKHQPNKWMR